MLLTPIFLLLVCIYTLALTALPGFDFSLETH